MAKRLFQQSLSDHCVGRSLSFGKVVAYSPRGSLYICTIVLTVYRQFIFLLIKILNRILHDLR